MWITAEAVYNAYSSFLLPLLEECVPQLASRKNLVYSDVSSLGKGFFRSSPFFQEDPVVGIRYHTGRNTRTIINGKQMLVLGGTDLIQAPEDTLRNVATTVRDLLVGEVEKYNMNTTSLKRPRCLEVQEMTPPAKRPRPAVVQVDKESLYGEIKEAKEMVRDLLSRLERIESSLHNEKKESDGKYNVNVDFEGKAAEVAERSDASLVEIDGIAEGGGEAMEVVEKSEVSSIENDGIEEEWGEAMEAVEKSEPLLIEKDGIVEEGGEAVEAVEKNSAVKFANSDDEEQALKSISATVEESKDKKYRTLTKKLGSTQYQSVGELYSGEQDECAKMTGVKLKKMAIFVDDYLREAEDYDALFHNAGTGEANKPSEEYADEETSWDEDSHNIVKEYCTKLRDAVAEKNNSAKIQLQKELIEFGIPRSYEFPVFLCPFHFTEVTHEVVDKISQENCMLSNFALNIVMKLFVLWEANVRFGARKFLSTPVISTQSVTDRPWYKFMPSSLENVSFVFFPVYHAKHFVLFAFSVATKKLKLYNSLQKLLSTYYIMVGENLRNSLFERYGIDVSFEVSESAQQFGATECGM